MKLKIPHPDRGFKTITKDGLTLIVPRNDKFDWAPEDRPYRSVVLNEEGDVVSTGFWKFGNLNEPGYEDHKALIETGEVVYTEKIDGVLALRSVINGQVVWRTRGTLDGGPHREQIEKAAERHPDLADPHFCPFGTLIFEFVSPDFRIILPYKEDKLIFLGYITHSDLSLLDWNRTKAMATLYDFELVPTHDLPSDLNELIAIVSKWEGQEGIVARTKDGKALVKAKGASYLALHRLKFQLSTNALRDLCDEKDITSLEDFKAYILTQGADWELLQDCEPIVQVYCNTRAQIDACFFALRMVHEQKVKEFPTRKDFAVEYANKAPVVERPSIYLLLDGQPEEAKRKLHKNMMDAAFEQFKDLDPKEEE